MCPKLQAAKLELAPARIVQIPRLAGAPVSLECREHTTLNIGRNRIIIGEVLGIWIVDDCVDADKFYVDSAGLHLIGRMGGAGGYTETGQAFEMTRFSYEEWREQAGVNMSITIENPTAEAIFRALQDVPASEVERSCARYSMRCPHPAVTPSQAKTAAVIEAELAALLQEGLESEALVADENFWPPTCAPRWRRGPKAHRATRRVWPSDPASIRRFQDSSCRTHRAAMPRDKT